MNFSNQVISITSIGREDFEKALSFFFRSSTDQVYAYRVTPNKRRLVFYWAKSDWPAGVLPLPYPMGLKAATDFAWHWLQNADYDHEPDHDGNNEKAWRVYNEDWTHVDDQWQALVAIQAVWAMYGK